MKLQLDIDGNPVLVRRKPAAIAEGDLVQYGDPRALCCGVVVAIRGRSCDVKCSTTGQVWPMSVARLRRMRRR